MNRMVEVAEIAEIGIIGIIEIIIEMKKIERKKAPHMFLPSSPPLPTRQTSHTAILAPGL